MRDFLQAISSRVVVYDGGMGATLEQFELTAEDYGGLQGKCHEALVLHRPDVIEGVHASMLEAGAEVVETDTFQASRLKLGEWGLADHTVEINTKAAEIARKAAGEHRFVAGSIGPTGYLPASEDPSLGQIRFGELVEVFAEQAAGLIDGGADLLIIETAQDILEVKAAVFGARAAFKSTGRTLPIHTSVSLLPNGGKMLLGHRHLRCAVHAGGAASRRDRPELLDRPGGHARRDPLPGRAVPGAGQRASPTPACRCRAPTARRSSPSSPSRWRRRWESSSSATASASSAAAAAPRPSTSPRSSSAVGRAPSRPDGAPCGRPAARLPTSPR